MGVPDLWPTEQDAFQVAATPQDLSSRRPSFSMPDLHRSKSLKIRPGSEDEMTEGTELQTAVSDSEAEALLAAFAGEEEGHGDAEQAATVINPTRYVTCQTWVQPQMG